MTRDSTAGESGSETVESLVADLDRDEKVSLLHGAVDPEGRATGYVGGVDRLDVPPLRMADGPLGVRIPGEAATAFPAPIALAATFDGALARELGAALGRETRGKDQDVLLAPGVNLVRVPQNGRNFEYYAEDPVLSASVAGAVVEGIQSADAIATPKHYVANSQETDRARIDAAVDERALRELYLPAFRAAVDAGAGSVMTAYNGVNGTPMSEHRALVRDVLKDEWGFEGYVVSDWFATRGAADAASGGLDVEMPGVTMAELAAQIDGEIGDDAGEEDDGGRNEGDGGSGDGDGHGEADEADGEADDTDPVPPAEFDPDLPEAIQRGMPDPSTCERFADALADAVEAGTVPEARLDDMVRRVLTAMDDVGMLDGSEGTDGGRSEGAVDTAAHRELATRVATRGTVLLENDGVLPLADDADVALVGPNVDEAILGGGGSSETTPIAETSPVEALRDRAQGEVTVAHGLPRVEGLSLLDAMTGEGDDGDGGGHGGDGGGGAEGDDEAADTEPAREPDVEAAADAAAAADVAVVFVRDTATEAVDRDSLRLPDRQDELVEAVAEANDRTVVVANGSGPLEFPWRDDVAAVLQGWYPGQAHGDAIAAVLYGDADPGGRLPVTFAPEDSYPTAGAERRFPGVDGTVHHDEGVLVGYRHFDATDAEPTYPFGYGRSYADFEYREVELAVGDDLPSHGGGQDPSNHAVRVTVANTDTDRPGREVVQAYVRPPDVEGVERPVREFAGAATVAVPAGEERTVTVELDDLAVRRWDPDSGWTVDPGTYVVEIARSAGDVRAEIGIERRRD